MGTELKTALSRMKELWDAGDVRAALKLAAGWPSLGEHGTAIRQAWAATVNPDFYRQIKKDPAALVAAGYNALVARYKLTPKGN